MESSGSEMLAYFDSDNHIFDFWLECVRQGKAEMIQDYCSEEEKRLVCVQLFMEDRAYALRTCMVVWVEAVKIAGKVDVPNTIVDKIFEEYMVKAQSASTPWMLLMLSETYLMELARTVNETLYDKTLSPVFLKFRKYIKIHICESLSIDEIAKALCISKSHLSHTIKNETGETVHRWIMKEKINMAKLMLSKKVYCMNEIWSHLGFCSQSHFAKCFRQMTGMTPSQFRRKADLS